MLLINADLICHQPGLPPCSIFTRGDDSFVNPSHFYVTGCFGGKETEHGVDPIDRPPEKATLLVKAEPVW